MAAIALAYLAKRGEAKRVGWATLTNALVDFSEPMLAKARAKPGAERVRFLLHDVAAPLPFADASFDRVLCALVLEHVADPRAFFAELGRVTRPDGRAVVTAMHPAMFLRGVSARFLDEASGELVRPRSFVLQLSDYVMAALDAGLRIVALSEHAADETLASRVPRAAKYVGWPMLLVMILTPGGAARVSSGMAIAPKVMR